MEISTAPTLQLEALNNTNTIDNNDIDCFLSSAHDCRSSAMLFLKLSTLMLSIKFHKLQLLSSFPSESLRQWIQI